MFLGFLDERDKKEGISLFVKFHVCFLLGIEYQKVGGAGVGGGGGRGRI